jgi:hypothetical protein
MTLEIIGAGFGRTGTLSLKLALEELGLGPCHHMKEVIRNDDQTRLWTDAAAGRPDFDRIFAGFKSTVDWPGVAFWRELAIAYPRAKIILSSRSAESWYASFSETILPTILDKDKWPEAKRPWFEMVEEVVVNRSLGGKTDRVGVIAAFEANEAAAKAMIDKDRLLVFEARQGWEPLCAFLNKPVPDTAFPRTNAKENFFEAVSDGLKS